MSEKFGGASEAAKVLGMPESSFNRLKLRVAYLYDPTTRSLNPLDRHSDDLRSLIHESHVVAPSLAGQSYPGRPWEFRLDLLRQYRRNGWAGAEYFGPSTHSHEKSGAESSFSSPIEFGSPIGDCQ